MLKGFYQDIGQTLKAATRLGGKEIAQVLPAFPDSVKPLEEMGMPFTPTPQIISEQMGVYGKEGAAPTFEPDYEPNLEMDMEMEPEMG